jgi:hypothetical protein
MTSRGTATVCPVRDPLVASVLHTQNDGESLVVVLLGFVLGGIPVQLCRCICSRIGCAQF